MMPTYVIVMVHYFSRVNFLEVIVIKLSDQLNYLYFRYVNYIVFICEILPVIGGGGCGWVARKFCIPIIPKSLVPSFKIFILFNDFSKCFGVVLFSLNNISS